MGILPLQIKQIGDKETLLHFMQQDRSLFAFALGNVDDNNDIKRFEGVLLDGSLAALALVWKGIKPPAYHLFGETRHVEHLLASGDGPRHVNFMVPSDLLDIFEHYYSIQSFAKSWRMSVIPTEFSASTAKAGLRRLSSQDYELTVALCGDESRPPSAQLLDEGVFYGIEDKGQLVAMAGTHICAPEVHVGVVGYVYTEPSARGQGYATTVTSAVTAELFRRNIDLVALNVLQSNRAAQHAYQKLGYRIHRPIVAGLAVKK